MSKTYMRALIQVVAVLFVLAVADASIAQEMRQYATAGGVEIHYGFLPAEVAGRRTAAHDAEPMHGRARRGDYHLIVALYDRHGERITDAELRATVGEFGMAGTRKTLEPMRIDDTVTFGNYFPMRSAGQYRVAIEIRLAGASAPIEARFDHHHR